MIVKSCRKCKGTKNGQEFHKNKNTKDGLSSVCKDCVTLYSRARWENNKEAESARSKEWRKNNLSYLKVYEKGKNNRKRYWPHLTSAQAFDIFMQIRKQQRECCAICSIHESKMAKGLVVDHCHRTLKVRQLLCQNCNALLGMAKESTLVLQNAVKYLIKHNELEGEACANF